MSRTRAMAETPATTAPGGAARGWGARLVKVVLLVVITWALYRSLGLNFSELNRDALARWRPAPAPLLGSAALLIAVYLTHAMLWRRIVGDLIGRPIGVATAFRIYFLANLGRYVPGRIWQVAGMAVLAQRAGIPALGAIAASALAQLCFLLSGTIFLAALMPLALGIGPALAAVAGCAILSGGVYWAVGTGSGQRVRQRLAGRLGPRAATALEAAFGAASRVRPSAGLLWLGGYIGSWLLLGGAFAIFTIAFVPASAMDARYLAGTMAAGYLSGYLAIFAPAGVGVREGVLGVLLARVVPPPAALLVSVASRIWFTITELLVLLVIPFLRRPAPAAGGIDVWQETSSD